MIYEHPIISQSTNLDQPCANDIRDLLCSESLLFDIQHSQRFYLLTIFQNSKIFSIMGWQTTFTLSKRAKGCHLVTDEVMQHIRPGLEDVKVRFSKRHIQHVPIDGDLILYSQNRWECSTSLCEPWAKLCMQILTVHSNSSQHTSAALTVNENYDKGKPHGLLRRSLLIGTRPFYPEKMCGEVCSLVIYESCRPTSMSRHGYGSGYYCSREPQLASYRRRSGVSSFLIVSHPSLLCVYISSDS